MSLEELNRLLDAYQDGTLEEGDARHLAGVIRSSSKQARWVMREFSLRGLITQAMEEADPEIFLRSFLERFNAEETRTDFQRAFEERVHDLQLGGAPQEREGALERWLPTQRLRSATTAPKTLKRRRRALVLVGLFAAAALLVSLALPLLRRGVAGEVVGAGPGVRRLHGGEEASLTKGERLGAGDRIAVPAGSFARIALGGECSLKLEGEALLLLEAREKNADTERQAVFLEKGSLGVEIGGGRLELLLLTPHAWIAGSEARAHLTVRPASTFIEVEKGGMRLRARVNGAERVLDLGPGATAVAGEGGVLESRAAGE